MKIIKETFTDDMFNTDLQAYKGGPLKDLLEGLDGKVPIIIEIFEGVDHYGNSGFNGRVNQVGWYLADGRILDIKSDDGYTVKVTLAV